MEAGKKCEHAGGGGQGVLIWGDARPKSLSYFIAELERTIITGHLQQTVLQGNHSCSLPVLPPRPASLLHPPIIYPFDRQVSCVH